ncbi:hypothetical protein V6N11_055833 [Hibiscus sabdariffa]|uniref:Uncharacterized protein n=1 Tax=Hibiscus sabdariffa TaxID=183260 RepID=A0ABR2T2V3_9ROSI
MAFGSQQLTAWLIHLPKVLSASLSFLNRYSAWFSNIWILAEACWFHKVGSGRGRTIQATHGEVVRGGGGRGGDGEAARGEEADFVEAALGEATLGEATLGEGTRGEAGYALVQPPPGFSRYSGGKGIGIRGLGIKG